MSPCWLGGTLTRPPRQTAELTDTAMRLRDECYTWPCGRAIIKVPSPLAVRTHGPTTPQRIERVMGANWMPICVIRLWPFTTRPDPAAARPADLVKRNFVADAEGLLDLCQTLLERREAIAVVLGQPGHRGARRGRHSMSSQGSCGRLELHRRVGTPPSRPSCHSGFTPRRGGLCHENVLNGGQLSICATLSGGSNRCRRRGFRRLCRCRRRFPHPSLPTKRVRFKERDDTRPSWRAGTGVYTSHTPQRHDSGRPAGDQPHPLSRHANPGA